MTLALYYSPGACSLSSHIALEETGAPHELRLVRLAEGENRKPEYMAINPRGRVPALALDDGTVLTECAAVLAYLALAYPQAKLWPESAAPQARCIEWLSWLASTVHVAFAQTRRPMRFVGQNEGAFPLVRAAGGAHLRAAFADIEKRLAASAYAVGDSYSPADMHLFVFHLWGRGAGLVDAEKTPAFVRWAAKIRARPAVQRTLDAEGLKLTW